MILYFTQSRGQKTRLLLEAALEELLQAGSEDGAADPADAFVRSVL